jgi:GxxExxY protein
MAIWGAARDAHSYAIIGAAIEVHNEFGPGFLEVAYARALRFEFQARRLPFEQEVQVPLKYKGQDLGVPFRCDFLCHGRILVELKALPSTGLRERAQLRHYLLANGIPTGLLLNLGETSLRVDRIDLIPPSPESPHPRPPLSESATRTTRTQEAAERPQFAI